MMTIRPAFIGDVEWLFEQCEAFAKFYGSKISLAGNPDYGRKFLEGMVQNHFVRIGMKDNVRAGFIAALVTPHHFNPDIRQLAELLWWVPEEHRCTGIGMMLFEDFMEYGKANCDWITFTLESISPIKDKFLLDRGFRLSERAYLMECK